MHNATQGSDSGSAPSIISNSDIEKVQSYIIDLQRQFSEHVTNMNKVITGFSNEEIVKSFYESGNYGQEVKERLEKLKDGLLRYHDNIEYIVAKTKDFLNEQWTLNNRR